MFSAVVALVVVLFSIPGAHGVAHGLLRRHLPETKDAVACHRHFSATDFPHCAVLQNDTYVLHWNSNDTHITFGIAAKTTGTETAYVALGLSTESMGMKNMDVAMISYDASDGFKIDDQFSTDYAPPVSDKDQNKTLLSAMWSPGGMLFIGSFVMPINSSDKDHDVTLDPTRWTYVMWAILQDGGYHGSLRGSTRLPLLLQHPQDADEEAVPVPTDAFHYTIQLPPMPFPTTRTTYMCIIKKAPADTKYHVYGARLIGEGRGVVHHNDLYLLNGDHPPPYPVDVPYDCTKDVAGNYGMLMYESTHQVFTSPPSKTYQTVDAALPVGKGFAEYMMLEVHFENIDGTTGYHDAIGYNLTLSPTLRKHDVGVMVLGAGTTNPNVNITSALAIPPGLEKFDYFDYCPRRCTRRLLPDKVNILFLRLHMHVLGQSMEVSVLRGGNSSRRETIASLRHYDFTNQQGMGFWPPGLPLTAGDSLVTRCTYDSSSKNTTTKWGLSGTVDEMCFSFVYYYPAPNGTFACFDMRNVSSNGLTFLRQNHLSVDYGFCATSREYQNATSAGDPGDFESQVFMNGIMQSIESDEL